MNSAFSPFFSQRWNVFAPNIAKSDRTLQIQVQWREDGELVHSDWVDVTEIELMAVRGNPAPSRISKVSVNTSNTLMTRFRALSDAGQSAAENTFITKDADGFVAMDTEDILDKLDPTGDDRSDAVRYLRYDYMLMRLSTAFGAAYFDKDPDEIERVRWQVTTQRVNDFTERFDEAPQYAASVVTFGWRQSTADIDPLVVDEYRDMIERYTTR